MEVSEIYKWFAFISVFLTIAIYGVIFTYNLVIGTSFAFNIAMGTNFNTIVISYCILSVYLIILPILAIYLYYNSHNITVKCHELFTDNLDNEISLIHISDLHIGSIRNKNLLKKLVTKINNTNTDLAIISGDLADGICDINNESFIELKDSQIPIIFTPGNHDHYPGIDTVISAAENAGITVLNNM